MPRIKRTHAVTGSIMHDGQLYSKGDTITFGTEVSEEHIRELLKGGFLAGPAAQELEIERQINEKSLGIRGMSPEEVKKLWRTFTNMTPAQRAAMEASEARVKETTDAARLANIAEAAEKTGPDEDLHDEDQGDADQGE
ncbi:MAG: hypothetical protein H0X24_23725 [Ktedonobacterales bacterium]|nr:hypothetical protein [Ktedonobacterales bacterium]